MAEETQMRRRRTPKQDEAPVLTAEHTLQDPHNLDAEQGLIASCLLDGSQEILSECFSRGITSESFYSPTHKILFEAICKLFEEGKPPDIILLVEHLNSRKLLDQVGGISSINQLASRIETPVHARYWMDIVRDKHLLRSLKRVSEIVIHEIYESPTNIGEFLGSVEERIFKIGNRMINHSTVSISKPVEDAMAIIHKMIKKESTGTGLMTGFRKFDQMTYGLHPQEMIVLAARPSVGKTSLAMNIAENISCGIAANNFKTSGTLVFSLEMSAEQLAMRLLTCRARVNLNRLRDGFCEPEEQKRLAVAARELQKAPIWIDDSGSTRILELRAKARRMKQKADIGLVVVDYLQLINGDPMLPRENQIADISRQIKAMAKELKVPVLVLSQLNRESEKEKRDPRLSDLRESGSIEQDADVVMMLSRPRKGDDDHEGDPGEIQLPADVEHIKLIIAKQRNGPVGVVDLSFVRRFTRYENFAEPEDRLNDPLSK
jgi:replicative DNA helicase